MKWLVNGEPADLSPSSDVEVERLSDRLVIRSPEGVHTGLAVRSGSKTLISLRGRTYTVERSAGRQAQQSASTGVFTAPMPGLVIDVLVHVGDTVTKGQKLLVLEAMKTQQPIVAPFDGVIEELGVAKGDQVTEGKPLVKVGPVVDE